MGSLATSSRVQLMVCSVCVTVTVLTIYSHLLLVDEIHNLTFSTVVLSADEGVRISFACVLAGAASLVLDYVLARFLARAGGVWWWAAVCACAVTRGHTGAHLKIEMVLRGYVSFSEVWIVWPGLESKGDRLYRR
jgi:hypothetical protein